MRLDKYTVSDLENEIARRKKEVEDKPKRISAQNMTILYKTCEEVINDIWSGEYHDDNDDQRYVYEAAMQALFGNDIFEKIKKRLELY